MTQHCRWMIRRDMVEVLAIENSTFPNPKPEEEFLRMLRQRNLIGMVVESAEGVAMGFMMYELHKDSLELLHFAVHPNYRRKKVGTAMLKKLMSKLGGHKRNHVAATVSERADAAHMLFKSQGWEASLIKHGEDNGDDSYRFAFWDTSVPVDSEYDEAMSE